MKTKLKLLPQKTLLQPFALNTKLPRNHRDVHKKSINLTWHIGQCKTGNRPQNINFVQFPRVVPSRCTTSIVLDVATANPLAIRLLHNTRWCRAKPENVLVEVYRLIWLVTWSQLDLLTEGNEGFQVIFGNWNFISGLVLFCRGRAQVNGHSRLIQNSIHLRLFI